MLVSVRQMNPLRTSKPYSHTLVWRKSNWEQLLADLSASVATLSAAMLLKTPVLRLNNLSII